MAASSFYNPTKKRQPLATIDGSAARKHAPHKRLSLLKLAHATRTFWTQAEAINYMEARQSSEKTINSGEILYLFSFESQPDGRRRYQVADIDIFIHEYYQLPANQRHTYEIIVEKKPSKLYFDLEFDTAANPTIDGTRLTRNFIQFVLNFMRKRSDDLNYSINDVLILDSTSPSKFSRHLIFQTADPFLNNLAVGRFVNLILEDIHGCLVNHRCAAVHNASPCPSQMTQGYADSSVFAKFLLAAVEPRLSRFERCQCVDGDSQLRFRDIVDFIVKKNEGGGLAWFCDTGVYTKNRAFRLLHSSKFDKPECFIVAPDNQWKPDLGSSLVRSSELAREIFMASLVYFNQPIRRFIHVDEEPQWKSKPAPVRSQKQSTYVTEDLQKIIFCYPELVNFMRGVAQETAVGEGKRRASRLYGGKEVQNDFKWQVSFLYVGDYKYCERIKRHHKNNNIYFVVNMRAGTYRQKCHDSDCKSFEGVERDLPPDTAPWLQVVNQDWDTHSPPSMRETL